MYLRMLDRLTREDELLVRTGLGLYEGRKLSAGARRVTPNGDCVKVIEEGGPVRGAGRLHMGQSTQL